MLENSIEYTTDIIKVEQSGLDTRVKFSIVGTVIVPIDGKTIEISHSCMYKINSFEAETVETKDQAKAFVEKNLNKEEYEGMKRTIARFLSSKAGSIEAKHGS